MMKQRFPFDKRQEKKMLDNKKKQDKVAVKKVEDIIEDTLETMPLLGLIKDKNEKK